MDISKHFCICQCKKTDNNLRILLLISAVLQRMNQLKRVPKAQRVVPDIFLYIQIFTSNQFVSGSRKILSSVRIPMVKVCVKTAGNIVFLLIFAWVAEWTAEEKGVFSLHRVFILILSCFLQTACSVYHALGDNHGSLWIISHLTLLWEGLIFSTQSGLSLTFTLSNLGSSCSINAAIVLISVLMEMQEHSSDGDTPAVRQEAPGEKWKSVAWSLSLQKCSKQRLSGGCSGEKYFWGKREKKKISGFNLFLHWSFPDLTVSKQSPEQTRHYGKTPPQWNVICLAK